MNVSDPMPKVAWVVGAAGGVGEATAKLLCSQGWHVVGTCRTAEQRRRLLERGACHEVVLMDLADADSVTRAHAELTGGGEAGAAPSLDALITCAAITRNRPLEVEGGDELRRLFEVNLFGVLRLAQLALPGLRATGGRIVMVGSSSGALGVPMMGAYSSSKFALEGLADALRREVSAQGVSVSLVIPNGIRTPMVDDQMRALDADIQALRGPLKTRYEKHYQRARKLMALTQRSAIPPERVAEDVSKALTDRKPKARYFCGVAPQLLRAATRVLPDSVWDDLLPRFIDRGIEGVVPEIFNHITPPTEEGMRQLSSFDALMVYGEKSRTPMHVSPFFIYDVSTAPNAFVRFKDVLQVFERSLPHAPILQRKLVRVPLDLDDPYWADDPDFDLEQHVRHIALPKPGDRRQLSILLARLSAYPMDLSRPPWDAFVIEGLDNVSGVPAGSFGLLLRIHHAAIDGHSGHALLRMLHELTPDARPKPPLMPPEAVPAPSKKQMLTRAYRKLWDKPGKLAKVVAQALSARDRLKALKRENPGEERPVPATRFSAPVSSQRVICLVPLDLDGLRNAKHAVEGATVNDAIVTVVSGAMRRYLQSKGELPAESMTTAMPVNVRTDAERDAPGNVVSMTTLNMHSDLADPLQRLQAIHASSAYSKVFNQAVGARVMSDVAESIPAGITSLGVRAAGAVGLINLPCNTLVTNVPGPQQPLYLAGAKVVEFHAVGILLDGLGLFHAVNSYCGRIAITVLADRHMLPDPAFYEECLKASYDELLAAMAEAMAQPAAAVKAAKPAPKPAAKNAARKAAPTAKAPAKKAAAPRKRRGSPVAESA